MVEPALGDLRFVGLDRGKQVCRIEACGKRAPPRLDDRRSQSYHGFKWELGDERAVGEQALPASLQLSSAPRRIRLRSDSSPLRRHDAAMVSLSYLRDFPASMSSVDACVAVACISASLRRRSERRAF